jgi:hypothetical protein
MSDSKKRVKLSEKYNVRTTARADRLLDLLARRTRNGRLSIADADLALRAIPTSNEFGWVLRMGIKLARAAVHMVAGRSDIQELEGLPALQTKVEQAKVLTDEAREELVCHDADIAQVRKKLKDVSELLNSISLPEAWKTALQEQRMLAQPLFGATRETRVVDAAPKHEDHNEQLE